MIFLWKKVMFIWINKTSVNETNCIKYHIKERDLKNIISRLRHNIKFTFIVETINHSSRNSTSDGQCIKTCIFILLWNMIKEYIKLQITVKIVKWTLNKSLCIPLMSYALGSIENKNKIIEGNFKFLSVAYVYIHDN